MKREEFKGQIDTNFWGVVNVTRAVVPLLRKQGAGHIIRITSIGGRSGFPVSRATTRRSSRSRDLDLPFVTYNAELLKMLTPQLDHQLAQHRKQQTCAEKVNWVLQRLLGGPRPEIADVARELGMSSRTLQRRITEQGTNFRRLLNDARQELARFYLRERSLGVNEIAYLLSYEDPSSFFRAFHEWEGKPPRRWRTAQRRA